MPAQYKTRQEQPSNEGNVPLTAIRLDAHHRALLEACAAHEFTTKTDTVRRAIRHYADHLGVTTKPKRKRNPKPKTK